MSKLRSKVADLWRRLFRPPRLESGETVEDVWQSRHRDARSSTLDAARRMNIDSKTPPIP